MLQVGDFDAPPTCWYNQSRACCSACSRISRSSNTSVNASQNRPAGSLRSAPFTPCRFTAADVLPIRRFGLRSLFSSRNNDRPERCRELCMVLDGVFADVKPLIRVGTTTAELDRAAARLIKAYGCESLFQNSPRNDFPTTITASVNDQVINNIPSSWRTSILRDIRFLSE